MDSDSIRCCEEYGIKKTPSIHMPRSASRITLEVERVRVHRLNQISYRDCLANGIPPVPCYDDGAEPETILEAARAVFRERWDRIYSKSGFGSETNPWVWAIEFRRLVPASDRLIPIDRTHLKARDHHASR